MGYLLSAAAVLLQPVTLGGRPRLWMWGNSSWPPPLGHEVLPAPAPGLGHGVAPLHHAMCAVAAALAMFHNFICEGYEKKGKHCLNNDSLEKHMI